jgi:hypothetical protein
MAHSPRARLSQWQIAYLAGDDLIKIAHWKRHFYKRSVLTNMLLLRMRVSKNGLQLSLKLLRQQRCKRRTTGLAKVGNGILDLMLPFTLLKEPLDSVDLTVLEKFVAMAPHALRNAICCQLVLRRIKVNRH